MPGDSLRSRSLFADVVLHVMSVTGRMCAVFEAGRPPLSLYVGPHADSKQGYGVRHGKYNQRLSGCVREGQGVRHKHRIVSTSVRVCRLVCTSGVVSLLRGFC
jgi:hypothetical protein